MANEKNKRFFLVEKRRRVKRPPSLVVFGLIFCVLPMINYFSLALKKSLPLTYPVFVIKALNTAELLLLFLPVIIGIGILMVRKWGWYLFLAYAAYLILYNLIDFFIESTIYNLIAVFQSFFGVIAIIFFTSKDISAPYMKVYPRGWRLQLRRPIQINININGKRKQTKDISEIGAYVKWKDCELENNSEIKLTMKLNENRYDIKAAVVRKDEKGIGIAYRGLTSEQKRQLRRDLQQIERENRAKITK